MPRLTDSSQQQLMGWYTSATILAALVPLTVVAVDTIRRIGQRCMERNGRPLPPGPTTLPLLGSVFSIKNKLPWLTYTEWCARYGDIVYVRLLDTDIIILNSTDIATELLEKRSRIYSDRPFIETAVPFGHDCNFSLSRYGDHWRLCRRIFHQTFHATAAVTFHPMQLHRARQLIQNIIKDRNKYPSHFSTLATAVAMSAVYDYEPSVQNDPMASIVHDFISSAAPAVAPGNQLLVKLFPFLPHMPDWLPGSWISRQARVARAFRDRMIERPYQHVQRRMDFGDQINAGMVSDHITRMKKLDGPHRSIYEIALKHASVTALLGSTDTTSSVLMTFTLAMVQNPRVWKRAQVEVDTAIGTDRLPEFEDRPSLPYVEAIIRETLRWRPVMPLLVPHAVVDNDIYKGYYIPKGATIFVNAWGISRDSARYPDAEKFIPERFLDAGGRLTDDDPKEFIFGFGRRKCPGRYVADASVWSAIATMLATLDFNLAKDADGNDIICEATFTNGFSDHPHPFPCQLTPRAHIDNEVIDHILGK